MKKIELSTGTLLVVAAPEDAINIRVAGHMLLWSIETLTTNGPLLPSLGFELLGHPSEITGEVWGEMCEGFNEDFSSIMKPGYHFCAAHNIQESDVLLFKTKNRQDDR